MGYSVDDDVRQGRSLLLASWSFWSFRSGRVRVPPKTPGMYAHRRIVRWTVPHHLRKGIGGQTVRQGRHPSGPRLNGSKNMHAWLA
ncbi:hypothetical protein C8Q74DRAFT_558835 [Fomes fomentarius]|nr:hypothetical protein C8Q74DRAFT_558835 [Fomes fomentarius]